MLVGMLNIQPGQSTVDYPERSRIGTTLMSSSEHPLILFADVPSS